MSKPGASYPLIRGSNLFPKRVVVGPDNKVTYKEMLERMLKLSKYLEERGIGKEDIVAVIDFNTVRFMEIAYALANIEAILLPINFRIPPLTLTEIVNEVRPKVLFYSSPFKQLADSLDVKEKILLDKYEDIIKSSPRATLRESNPDAYYALLYTSGTTGKPKGTLYRQWKMVEGALSIVHQLSLYETPAKLTSKDTMLSLIPMFHILSWGSIFIAPFIGAKLVFVEKIASEIISNIIKNEEVTWLNAVPTMIYTLLEAKEQFNGLKVLLGGSPVPANLAERMKKAGMVFSTIYGATDMLATSISIITDSVNEDDLRVITHPVPYAEVKVVREGSVKAGVGESGEIWYRSPWMPEGYYMNPEKTKESFIGGWFKTGDLGEPTIDGGIKVLDRVKDAIKSGGEWIPSSTLESIISEVEGVGMVAVIPVKDEKWGERPVALYTGSADADVIRKHMEEAVNEGRIAKWWIPDKFLKVEEFPLTSTGKVNKRGIKAMMKKILEGR